MTQIQWQMMGYHLRNGIQAGDWTVRMLKQYEALDKLTQGESNLMPRGLRDAKTTEGRWCCIGWVPNTFPLTSSKGALKYNTECPVCHSREDAGDLENIPS
jgi:hypothetical protein